MTQQDCIQIHKVFKATCDGCVFDSKDSQDAAILNEFVRRFHRHIVFSRPTCVDDHVILLFSSSPRLDEDSQRSTMHLVAAEFA
jgi:uncharacterized Rossmann fold enzyme